MGDVTVGQLHKYQSCIEEERKALFELKINLMSQSSDSNLTVFDILRTWTDDLKSNCCRWEGVKCNLKSGRVSGLAFPHIYLPSTSLINLSLLHPFEELRSLDLSGNRFVKTFGGFFDDDEGYKSLGRLRNLETLDLSLNMFNNSIFPFLNAATSLTTLFLRDNNMDGPFLGREIRDLKNLELLDLSGNRFNGSIPVQELSAMRKLKALDISGNEFSGSMELQGICKLKNMQELDLSENKLVGQFPLCLTSMTGLRVLDLSSNQLTGNIPSAIGSLESLEYLSLIDNNFEGRFSFSLLTNLSKLRVFKIGSTSNLLQVDSVSSWKPKFQLRDIVLRFCNLEEVPHFLLHQKYLRQVDLSYNNITGTFLSWLLMNNTKLEALHIQNNSLTSFQLLNSAHNLQSLNVSANEFNDLFPENFGYIFAHLRYMNLANNGFHGNLPSSLGNMKNIEFLDISHNSFHGRLPRSFVKGCYSIKILKLSHNKLSGEIFPESTNFTDISVLFMDNNQFTGKIGQGLRSLKSVTLLDISNNNLTGVIPSWISEFRDLSALLIANNSLKGEIPVSLFNISYLRLLDLSANILSGNIPPRIDSLSFIALFLEDNKLSGAIPDTLLVNVVALDLRNNRLSGHIPELINSQKNLYPSAAEE